MKYINLVLLLLLALFPASIRAEETPDTLQVEVYIFSGKQPPKYFITDPKQIEAIFKLVESAPVVNLEKKEGVLSTGGGGYSGFRIYNLTKKHPEIEELFVYKTDIEIWKSSPKATEPEQQFRTDAGSNLQRELLRLLEEGKVVGPSVMHWIKYGHVTKVIPGKTLE